MKNFIAEILFPPHCVSCRKEGSFLCDKCKNSINLLKNPCRKNPLQDSTISTLYTPCDYHSNKALQKALHGLKYKYYKDVSKPLAEILAHSFQESPPPKNINLVPIPLHKKRESFRGFNQAEMLAKHLSTTTGYPMKKALSRERNTISQATLNREKRLKNMKDAFVVNSQNAPRKNIPIMLVDDVCTTLSTFKAAAQTLQNAGYTIILCTALAQA